MVRPYGRQSTRQRLINLMYLVFIALLAIKVSPSKEEQEQPQHSTTASPAQSEDKQASTLSPHIIEGIILPESSTALAGQATRGRLILSLRDSCKVSELRLNGHILAQDASGYYLLPPQSAGRKQLTGTLLRTDAAGQVQQLPWRADFTVQTPLVSIAPQLTQVLYAGIDNPIELAVSGLSTDQLILSSSEAQLKAIGPGLWSLHPAAHTSSVQLALAYRLEDGRIQSLGTRSLRVRPLPKPSPYLELEGNTFRGGRITRQALLATPQLSAGLEDGLLEISYSVERFQLISFDALGNALPESSSSAQFTPAMRSIIRQTARGGRLYLSDIIARSPDGRLHRLAPLELIIN